MTQGAQARAQKEASDEALATPLQDPSSAGSSEGQLRKIAIFTVVTLSIQRNYSISAYWDYVLGVVGLTSNFDAALSLNKPRRVTVTNRTKDK